MSEAERDLYRRPPAAFVAARNDLAREKKRAGDRADAARVAKLIKPSAALWAVNQLARRNPLELSSYVEAHLRARDRQIRALADSGTEARSLADTAARQERRMLEVLVDIARGYLEQGELAATKTNLDRIRTNLRAALVSAETKTRLEEGWLERDLEEPGFDSLAAVLRDTPPDWLEREIQRLAALRTPNKAAEPDPPTLPDVAGAADAAVSAASSIERKTARTEAEEAAEREAAEREAAEREAAEREAAEREAAEREAAEREAAEREAAEREAKKRALQRARRDAEQAVEARQRAWESLREQRVGAETAYAEARREAEALRRRLESMRAELESLERAAASAEATIVTRLAAVEELRAQEGDAKEGLEAARAARAALEGTDAS